MNIPNLPIQILAVTDNGAANAFFNNDLSHLLLTDGNATADRLHAHFMTYVASSQQKSNRKSQYYLLFSLKINSNPFSCFLYAIFQRGVGEEARN